MTETDRRPADEGDEASRWADRRPADEGDEASRWAYNFRREPLSVLARYVSQLALEGTDLRLRDAPAVRRRARRNGEAGDLAVARAIYETLIEIGIDPAWEEWAPRPIVQPIRHPAQVVYDRHADCLDLALLYAGVCQAALVPAMLVLVSDHAFVLVQPGRFERALADDQPEPLDEAWPPLEIDGASEGEGKEAGVHRVLDPAPLKELIARGAFTAIDPYMIARRKSFEQATESGLKLLEERKSVFVVDVPWLHSRPQTASVRAPARVVQMVPYIPGGDDLFVGYPSRDEADVRLRERSGVVVLSGDSGVGKSMLARHLAANASYGAGWFLNASNQQSLINGLARAHSASREQRPGGRDEKDREELALAALVVLRTAAHPWIVVLDNADGEPGPLTRWLPTPDPAREQLVIVTTTNERQWREQPGVEMVALEPLSQSDVQSALGRTELIELAEGRPLLIDAFAKLLEFVDEERLERALLTVSDQQLDSELRGPAVVWSAIRDGAELDRSAFLLAASIALLPPDHQPLAALRSIQPDADARVSELARAGLISLDAGIVRMHRLFGRVVREELALSAPSDYRAAAMTLASTPETIGLLEAHGDRETTKRLSTLLTEGQETIDREVAMALHAIGRTLELQGDPIASATAYELAEPSLVDPLLIADCLHGRARAINQHPPTDEHEAWKVEEALDWAKRAQELIEAEAGPNKAGRCVAMRGLLLQKLARFEAHAADRGELLRRARALIVDAHDRREADLAPNDPELLRSRFNFGGIEINLAQHDPGAAAMYLDSAEETYLEVGKRRRELYGVDIHPHIAACNSGLVLVGYYRSTLIAAGEVQRSAWLREATDNALAAIHQQDVLEGAADGKEIRKVAARLVKAALARHVRPGHEREEAEKLFAEILSELPAPTPSQT